MQPTQRHLIQTNDLSNDEIEHILAKAKEFLPYLDCSCEAATQDFIFQNQQDKPSQLRQSLFGKNIITIFFENSTRTLSSFECAIKNLGGAVTRLDVSRSSTAKGETISDTAANQAKPAWGERANHHHHL